MIWPAGGAGGAAGGGGARTDIILHAYESGAGIVPVSAGVEGDWLKIRIEDEGPVGS